MVSRYMVDDGAEDRVERQESVRHLRVWELSNGLGVVTQKAELYPKTSFFLGIESVAPLRVTEIEAALQA